VDAARDRVPPVESMISGVPSGLWPHAPIHMITCVTFVRLLFMM